LTTGGAISRNARVQQVRPAALGNGSTEQFSGEAVATRADIDIDIDPADSPTPQGRAISTMP
jgi:hypothetical protein